MNEELQEKITWQNINSSKEKGKILTGNIIAIEVEKMKDKNIICAIVNFKGIKVLIPAKEMMQDATNNKNDRITLRSMMGAKIKFIVIETDKISSKAIASRVKAMERIKEINLKKLETGDKIYGRVVAVLKKYVRLECVGFDFIIKAQDLQYGFIEDVSKIYKVNDQIKVVIKEIDKENKKLKISIKDLLEDPFKNIRKDFTEGGEYLATITGYTDNGIYANISQGIDTICILPTWLDKPPMIGDKVIVKIYKISPEKRKVYSSLVMVMGCDVND